MMRVKDEMLIGGRTSVQVDVVAPMASLVDSARTKTPQPPSPTHHTIVDRNSHPKDQAYSCSFIPCCASRCRTTRARAVNNQSKSSNCHHSIKIEQLPAPNQIEQLPAPNQIEQLPPSNQIEQLPPSNQDGSIDTCSQLLSQNMCGCSSSRRSALGHA